MEQRSGQVGEGSGSNASLPTAADLEALEQGIKEGLAEGLTVETAPQDAVKPRAPAGMVDEPFVSPRGEEESLKELWSSRQEREDPGTRVQPLSSLVFASTRPVPGGVVVFAGILRNSTCGPKYQHVFGFKVQMCTLGPLSVDV